ncbi:helix-turn-helix domain-containing protein [Streptomyces polyrhachis]|uniref:Helix-turn-helix domain-containing protein n=1 Tax=Streptomyces polyrhachis TaxID=1282885 RepID=A0ABW2GN84_9ACTN
MPLSPSSSAQAAREAVAARLRELRRNAGLTVAELAGRCGWHHSKTSRIENARTAPNATDIRLWCRACEAPEQVADLVAQSVHAGSLYMEWRRRTRARLRQLQESYGQLHQETRVFRVYSARVLPGLLQTGGYVGALLSGISAFHDIPDDVPAAVEARLARSRIIHEPGHRFLFLVEEAALHYRLGDAEVMAAQLGHLLTAGALPQVSLGIIPADTPSRPIRPLETFHAYDDTLVSVELLTAQVNVTQPSEIALYLKAFEELRQLAVYGAQARGLILGAAGGLG